LKRRKGGESERRPFDWGLASLLRLVASSLPWAGTAAFVLVMEALEVVTKMYHAFILPSSEVDCNCAGSIFLPFFDIEVVVFVGSLRRAL
jgi:hypothetical protein